MGSMITLGIDKFEIDWGKNNFWVDHSALFLPSDVVLIPYYYADDVVEMKEGLSRKLCSVKRRLDLLGYSQGALASIYQEHLDNFPAYYPDIPISFDQFQSIVSSIDLDKVSINLDCEPGECDLGEFVSRYVFRDAEVMKLLPPEVEINIDIGTFFENLDPYLTLRLLAENKNNADRMVQWRYADVVDGGWVDRDEIVTQLPDKSKVLVVTEGSTDSFIIERAMSSLCPDIADFFYFVDMEENYPFTGTGNLFKFCQGLSRIKIQNNVLVIFDNDAAGVENYDRACNLDRPRNMQICKLPDHEFFSNFKTVGPSGSSKENINGSAVAIECFLDLSKIREKDRCVRWTSYNRTLRRYQGEIDNKNRLVRAFKRSNLTDGGYDTSRLKYLLDYIVDKWTVNANYPRI
jgi:hypothetical protein